MRQESETPERCSFEVRRGSDVLLVNFCSANFRPGRYELRELFEALPCDYLIIGDPSRLMALEGIHGIAASRPELDAWVADRAGGYRRVIMFGTSVGGSLAAQMAKHVAAALSIGISSLSGYRTSDISGIAVSQRFIKSIDEVERILNRPGAPESLARYTNMAEFIGLAPPDIRHIVLSTTSDFSDRLNGWRLQQIPGFRVFDIPDVMHPGLSYLVRRGHLPDLLHLAITAEDPAAACIEYCDSYFSTYLEPESIAQTLQRKARRARRRRQEMARLLADGGDGNPRMF